MAAFAAPAACGSRPAARGVRPAARGVRGLDLLRGHRARPLATFFGFDQNLERISFQKRLFGHPVASFFGFDQMGGAHLVKTEHFCQRRAEKRGSRCETAPDFGQNRKKLPAPSRPAVREPLAAARATVGRLRRRPADRPGRTEGGALRALPRRSAPRPPPPAPARVPARSVSRGNLLARAPHQLGSAAAPRRARRRFRLAAYPSRDPHAVGSARLCVRPAIRVPLPAFGRARGPPPAACHPARVPARRGAATCGVRTRARVVACARRPAARVPLTVVGARASRGRR